MGSGTRRGSAGCCECMVISVEELMESGPFFFFFGVFKARRTSQLSRLTRKPSGFNHRSVWKVPLRMTCVRNCLFVNYIKKKKS